MKLLNFYCVFYVFRLTGDLSHILVKIESDIT